MPDALKDSWNSLWHRLGAKGDPAAAFEELSANYANPPRAYHNLNHIADCLEQLRPARPLAQNLEAVELAIWFHDAVYDSKAKDNEERSAEMASIVIAEARLPGELGRIVLKLILATKHVSPPAGSDSALVVDVDLSILGRPPAEFDRYESQIREEYAWVESAAFNTGRSRILKSFLDRPNIYSTEFFRQKYEIAAQQNLTRSVQTLQNQSPSGVT